MLCHNGGNHRGNSRIRDHVPATEPRKRIRGHRHTLRKGISRIHPRSNSRHCWDAGSHKRNVPKKEQRADFHDDRITKHSLRHTANPLKENSANGPNDGLHNSRRNSNNRRLLGSSRGSPRLEQGGSSQRIMYMVRRHTHSDSDFGPVIGSELSGPMWPWQLRSLPASPNQERRRRWTISTQTSLSRTRSGVTARRPTCKASKLLGNASPAKAAGDACCATTGQLYPIGTERTRWPFLAEIKSIQSRLPNPERKDGVHPDPGNLSAGVSHLEPDGAEHRNLWYRRPSGCPQPQGRYQVASAANGRRQFPRMGRLG